MMLRRMVIVGSLVALMSACASEYGGSVNREVEPVKNGFPSESLRDEVIENGPLFNGGVVSIPENPNVWPACRVETGTFKGAKYKIYYSDGSGRVQGLPEGNPDSSIESDWCIYCYTDKMDDSRWCCLRRGNLTVGIRKDGSYFISIGHEHYPGSTIAIRVDKNEPISASESAGFSSHQVSVILDQLTTGNTLLTRYQEWPYQTNRDDCFSPYGFSQAWEILQVIYDSVRL